MSKGKQNREGQAARRQIIIDYIREHGPVKSGQMCKDLGMSRSSLSDDINAINAVSGLIEFPKRGYYVLRTDVGETASLRGMIDAEHVRRWMILKLLTKRDLSFEELKEKLSETGIICSNSTLHNSLRVMKDERMILSLRSGSSESYRAVMKIISADQKQIKHYQTSAGRHKAGARVFFESYDSINRKLAYISHGSDSTNKSPKNLRTSGKRNTLSEEQISQLSELERFDYRNYALEIHYHSAKRGFLSTVLRVGLILYSVETNRIYLIGKNELDYDTIIPLDSIDREQLAIACKEDKPINNYIYNKPEFQQMKRQMLNISTEEAKDVKVRFARLRSIDNRLKRFQEVRSSDRNPAVFTPNEDRSEMIYTDRIRGLGDFSRFIRRFGRAAIVESPLELRESIMDSSRKIIALYENPEEE